jgi:arsenate reductase
MKWLNSHDIEHDSTDIVASPPPIAVLRDLVARSGLEIRRFFNTSGQSYREGGWKDRIASIDPEEALAALARDGKLIKRPILDTGREVLVGFAADDWARLLT